jgi:hypothetical protein
MHTVDAVLVVESRLGGIISVLPMSGQRWLVQCILPNELVVVDEQLTPIWRVRLPPGRLGRAAVAEDLSLVALAQAGHLLLLDATGRQLTSFPNPPPTGPSISFSCGAFTADGARLWAIVATGGAGSSATADQELWLIDVATRSVLDRRRLAVTGDDGQLVRHPDGRTIGLRLWIEDGAAIGWARRLTGSTFALPRGRIACWQLCTRPGWSTSRCRLTATLSSCASALVTTSRSARSRPRPSAGARTGAIRPAISAGT